MAYATLNSMFTTSNVLSSCAHHEVGGADSEVRERHVQGLGKPQEAAANGGRGKGRERGRAGGGVCSVCACLTVVILIMDLIATFGVQFVPALK